MARRRLHNDDWGYETNCFVCEARNSDGLQIPFWADDERQVVEAEFSLSRSYSGAPTLVHGGVLLAICDEAMAWATIALAGQWALTAESSAKFLAMVGCDSPHRVTAHVVERDGDRIETRALITDLAANVCVEAGATFVAIGEATAQEIVSEEIAPEHRSFLAED